MSTSEPETVQVPMACYPRRARLKGVWRVTRDPLPDLAEEEVRVRLTHTSIDRGMRGWITPRRSYMPVVTPREVMRVFGVGEVVKSRSARLKAGDWITGFTGVQTLARLPARGLRPIRPDLAPHLFLSCLGMTGYTCDLPLSIGPT